MRDGTADKRFLVGSIYLAKVFGRAQKKHVFGKRGYFRESHERKFEENSYITCRYLTLLAQAFPSR